MENIILGPGPKINRTKVRYVLIALLANLSAGQGHGAERDEFRGPDGIKITEASDACFLLSGKTRHDQGGTARGN